MSANSKIEWTDHTFNPWRGCTKVSAGCANCYAETLSRRNPKVLGEWGRGKPRVLASEAMWRQPLKWNRDAAHVAAEYVAADYDRSISADVPPPTRPKVFCASLADWLDDEVPVEWLARLLALIHATPHLDWLLLTKRPENWYPRIEAIFTQLNIDPAFYERHQGCAELVGRWFGEPPYQRAPANVWIGVSVEDQAAADARIPRLLAIPAQVRFLSCEPLLGALDLGAFLRWRAVDQARGLPSPLSNAVLSLTDVEGIDWVICGGESGPGARPMHPDWARGLRDQCEAAGVAFFFKQWGEWCPFSQIPDETLAEVELEEGGMTSLGEHSFHRLGKKAAGRELDGCIHSEWPR